MLCLNGWVRTKRSGSDAVLGPYGDIRVNDVEKHFVDLCEERNLLLANICIHREGMIKTV